MRVVPVIFFGLLTLSLMSTGIAQEGAPETKLQKTCKKVDKHITKEKSCDRKWKLFQKNLPKCANVAWQNEEHFYEERFEVGIFGVTHCFEGKNSYDKAIEIYQFGLTLPDFTVDDTINPSLFHGDLESHLDAAQRPAPTQCFTSEEEFEKAVRQFAATKDLSVLKRSLSKELFSVGDMWSDNIEVVPFPWAEKYIDDHLPSSGLKVTARDGSYVFVSGWKTLSTDPNPYDKSDVYVFGTKRDEKSGCFLWNDLAFTNHELMERVMNIPSQQ